MRSIIWATLKSIDCRICTRNCRRETNPHYSARRVADVKRTAMILRGTERLRQELKQLKSEALPNIIKAIAEARAHGDLSENAEYHAAREQQSFVEGRINDIENRLSNSEVIDVTKLSATGRVVFGATVQLEDQHGGAKVEIG